MKNTNFVKVLAGYVIVAIVSFGLAPFSASTAYAEEEIIPVEESSVSAVPETITEVVQESAPGETPNEVSDTSSQNSETSSTDPAPVSGDITIETGDAVAHSDTETVANNNETLTGTESASTTSEVVQDYATTTPEGSLPTNITNENEALIGNTADTEAVTGINIASTTDNVATSTIATTDTATTTSDAIIDTGDAISTADLTSIANLNSINSSTTIEVINNFGDTTGSINLQEALSGMGSSSGGDPTPCGSQGCQHSNNALSVYENDNAATSTTNADTLALTGENIASSTNGTGEITTGDAYASTNLLNVINTNIVDSNLFLLFFNNFGNWDGNLILPNLNFFENFFGSQSTISSFDITNNNTADVINDILTLAETGQNNVEGDTNASIQTGDAEAQTTLLNYINSNIIGGGHMEFIINVTGAWDGSIYNLPDYLSVTETPTGFMIYKTTEETSGSTDPLSITNNNIALIRNAIITRALTGGNSASGNNAFIATGDAFASTNVANFVNTNIYGSNFAAAVINIFGDWRGYVAFGEPDLWIGAVAETDGSPEANDTIRYSLTVTNFGNAVAHNVKIDADFDHPFLRWSENQDQRNTWDIGTIEPGQTVLIAYEAQTGSELPETTNEVGASFVASAHEPDANEADNTEFVSLVFQSSTNSGGSSGGVGGRGGNELGKPMLKLKKYVSRETITPPSEVEYTIEVFNVGEDARGVTVTDVLTSESGEIISKQSWELGDVFPSEKILITYTVVFDEAIEAGVFTNEAQAFWTNGESKIASAVVTILPHGNYSTNDSEMLLALGTDEKVSGAMKSEVAIIPQNDHTYIEPDTDPIPPSENLAAVVFGAPENLAQILNCTGIALIIISVMYVISTLAFKTNNEMQSGYLRKKIGFHVIGTLAASTLLYAFQMNCPIPFLLVLATLHIIAVVVRHIKR